jgi:hypothetical protein
LVECVCQVKSFKFIYFFSKQVFQLAAAFLLQKIKSGSINLL